MMDDDDDDDKWTLVASYCQHFWGKCGLLTFFQLKLLVVDVFTKNVGILPKNIRNQLFFLKCQHVHHFNSKIQVK